MLRVSWLALFVGCGAGKDEGETETVVIVPAEVRGSGPVTCANPEAREEGWFEPPRHDGTPADDGAAQTGGALLVEDLDDDGHLDLFVPVDRDERGVVVFWGTDGDRFERDDQTFAMVDGSIAVGASSADVDSDGDLDVLVSGWNHAPQLLINEGWRAFRVAEEPFPDAPRVRAQSASWADVDADGDLDLFVGAYGDIAVIDVLRPEPDCSDHVPDRSVLWLNDGTGRFSDASESIPDAVHDGLTFGTAWLDIDGDSLPELFVANDDGLCVPSTLMWRGADGAYTASTAEGFHTGSHDMGIGVGDLNGDRQPDFLMTSWNRITLLQSTETPDGPRWVDATAARGFALTTSTPGERAQPGDQVFGWGTELGDLDNDGDLDAVAVFGYWEAYPGAGDPETQRDAVFVQNDDGTFVDRAGELGLDDDGVGRAVVLADLDGNGALDIVKRVLDRPNPLHLQRCTDRAWVSIVLRDPRGLNTFAVGSRITVRAGDQQQVRWVTSGSTGLYTGAPMRAHVGLGAALTVDVIEVRWPDGTESVLEDVATRQQLTIVRQR